MILVSIECSKIDKSRLYQGKNGKFLDLCLIETPNSPYGNSHMVTQSVSKEDRMKGIKGNILGNAKTIGGGRVPPEQTQGTTTTTVMNEPAKTSVPVDDSDVPF